MPICPISNERIDEYSIRIVGGLVCVFVLGYLMVPSIWWEVILVWDFAARLYVCRWSPLGTLGKIVASKFFRPKWIDAAPKQFAARVGLILSGTALLLNLFGWVGGSTTTLLVLGAGALLESLFGFCIGCWLYRLRFSLR